MKLIFCMQINIKFSYNLILLSTIVPKLPKITSLQNLCDISRKKRGMKLIICANEHHSYIKGYYHFWWTWKGMPKVLKIKNMQCLCNILRKNWVMKLMSCMLINMEVFYKLLLLFLIGLARLAQSTRESLQTS